jgi:3-deoxy-D-manno-octulosonic-acid transferase
MLTTIVGSQVGSKTLYFGPIDKGRTFKHAQHRSIDLLFDAEILLLDIDHLNGAHNGIGLIKSRKNRKIRVGNLFALHLSGTVPNVFSLLLYALFIRIFALAVRIAAVFSTKAREWVAGRKNWASALEAELARLGDAPRIWMHCASAGEFEQGKPLLEELVRTFPGYKIVVSFFSPSGYGVGKKYKGADLVTYLPLDTAANAQGFLHLLQPELVIFIKYDYWYHHLRATAARAIPLLLASAIFRPQQPFFRWYGGLHRKMLHFFTWLFVQDEESVALLRGIGANHASANGDTRFDRVATLTTDPAPLPLIESFAGLPGPLLVAGSTWKEDEELLAKLEQEDLKLIIAPHEISETNIKRLKDHFGKAAITYSDLVREGYAPPGIRILLINNIGMLSRLYRYGDITYIGGGFNKSGIHNTLEAAAWGKPVLFGPNYQKFREAKGLIAAGAAASVSEAATLNRLVTTLLTDATARAQWGSAAANYVRSNIGATRRVLQFIQEKRLLTRP